MKRTIALLIFAVLAVAASAQVGGNDWTALTGQSWTATWVDGTTHTRTLFYSPSTVTRSGDIIDVTLDTVFSDNTPTKFYQLQLNCRTNQYTFAEYDVTVSPARLGERSMWKDFQPNSPAPAAKAVLCK